MTMFSFIKKYKELNRSKRQYFLQRKHIDLTLSIMLVKCFRAWLQWN